MSNTTTMRGKFTTPDAAVTFTTGGNATITARSTATGNRFTFKVSTPMNRATGKRQDTAKRFVSVMTGSDNESDYTYLGMLGEDGKFAATRATSPSLGLQFKAFDWVWAQISNGKMPASLELWHEGRCGRCGRKLTVPESIESGFGPECRHHV